MATPMYGVLAQVRRWAKQYHAQLTGPPLPQMERLIAWLQGNIPAADADASQARIAHGDYRCALCWPCDHPTLLLSWVLASCLIKQACMLEKQSPRTSSLQ